MPLERRHGRHSLSSLKNNSCCPLFESRQRSEPTSTDNDPLYRFPQWLANLVLEVTEIKSVPYVPLSHPFVERLIGSLRRSQCCGHFFPLLSRGPGGLCRACPSRPRYKQGSTILARSGGWDPLPGLSPPAERVLAAVGIWRTADSSMLRCTRTRTEPHCRVAEPAVAPENSVRLQNQ